LETGAGDLLNDFILANMAGKWESKSSKIVQFGRGEIRISMRQATGTRIQKLIFVIA
jgi:hypothetical protein